MEVKEVKQTVQEEKKENWVSRMMKTAHDANKELRIENNQLKRRVEQLEKLQELDKIVKRLNDG